MIDVAPGRQRHANWLAETVRLSETRWGPYDDADAVRALRHANLSAEDAVRERQLILARREGLDTLAARWRDYAVLLVLGAGLLAVLAGCGAALGALGDGTRPVNLFWALGGLLGVHIVTFVLWLGSLLWRRQLGSWLSRVVVGLAGRLTRLPPLAAAGERLAQRPSAAALLPHALVGLLARAGIARWLAGLVGNLWWLLALLSALVTLLALLSTRRYGFVWETTLLAPDTFVAVTQALGRLPAALGFAVPDAAAVRASGGAAPLDAPVQVLWSNWLLGCVVVYGILPRFVASALSTGIVLLRRRRLRLDMSLPAYAALRERLSATSAPVGIADAAPDSLAHTGGQASAYAAAGQAGALASGYAGREDETQARVLVGIELPPDTVWPPQALPARIIDAGILDGRTARNALLDQFAKRPPGQVVVLCDAGQTPDRGTVGLVAELAQRAARARVCLSDGRNPARLQAWRERLLAAGLPSDAIIEDTAHALAWLQAQTPEAAS